jgi:hypothetical protein
MACRPRLNFLFKKACKRQYLLCINSVAASRALVFDSLSFEAQVGLLGHELAHLLSYMSMSNRQILAFSLRYLTRKQRRLIEAETDSLAIERGFADGLIEFAQFVEQNPNVAPVYRRYKKQIYLSKDELIALRIRLEMRREHRCEK